MSFGRLKGSIGVAEARQEPARRCRGIRARDPADAEVGTESFGERPDFRSLKTILWW